MKADRADEAIPWVEKGLRYNPQPPTWYRQLLVLAEFLAEDYTSALENLRRLEGGFHYDPPTRFAAIALLQVTGCREEAVTEVKALLADSPDASIQSAAAMFVSYKNSSRLRSLLDALRDAGLPEEGGMNPSNVP